MVIARVGGPRRVQPAAVGRTRASRLDYEYTANMTTLRGYSTPY